MGTGGWRDSGIEEIVGGTDKGRGDERQGVEGRVEKKEEGRVRLILRETEKQRQENTYRENNSK